MAALSSHSDLWGRTRHQPPCSHTSEGSPLMPALSLGLPVSPGAGYSRVCVQGSGLTLNLWGTGADQRKCWGLEGTGKGGGGGEGGVWTAFKVIDVCTIEELIWGEMQALGSKSCNSMSVLRIWKPISFLLREGCLIKRSWVLDFPHKF